MKKISNYLAITFCFVLGTNIARADADANSYHEKMQEKMYNAMDSNADGTLTSNEFNTFFSNKFKELDVNGNGQITLEEMKAGHKKMNDGRRRKMDNSEMNSSGMPRTHKDSSNPKSETISTGGSNESCCWTP